MEINSGELHFKTSWNSQIKLQRDYVLIVILCLTSARLGEK